MLPLSRTSRSSYPSPIICHHMRRLDVLLCFLNKLNQLFSPSIPASTLRTHSLHSLSLVHWIINVW
jgi:hypothetical protein